MWTGEVPQLCQRPKSKGGEKEFLVGLFLYCNVKYIFKKSDTLLSGLPSLERTVFVII